MVVERRKGWKKRRTRWGRTRVGSRIRGNPGKNRGSPRKTRRRRREPPNGRPRTPPEQLVKKILRRPGMLLLVVRRSSRWDHNIVAPTRRMWTTMLFALSRRIRKTHDVSFWRSALPRRNLLLHRWGEQVTTSVVVVGTTSVVEVVLRAVRTIKSLGRTVALGRTRRQGLAADAPIRTPLPARVPRPRAVDAAAAGPRVPLPRAVVGAGVGGVAGTVAAGGTARVPVAVAVGGIVGVAGTVAVVAACPRDLGREVVVAVTRDAVVVVPGAGVEPPGAQPGRGVNGATPTRAPLRWPRTTLPPA